MSASKEYLSRLQNGKKPPASEKLNIALAKITENDPMPLLISAVIHKAPENIKSALSGYLDIFYSKNDLSMQLSKAAYEVNKKFPDFTKGIYDEEVLMKDDSYRRYKELSKSFFKKHFKEEINITNEDRKFYSQKRNTEQPLKVPILKTIKYNQPIINEKYVSEWTYVPNRWNLTEDETFLLKVPDNSMENSRIHADDLVVVKICSEFKDGDIVVINSNGGDATLKKIKNIDSDKAWVYPSNCKSFEPKIIELKKVRIIGKVIQIQVTPQ
ncbi:LexA family protein [Paenibacillus taihuensis]|uniref:LexA family protein n=1 Tax=Paenibacillus taihuensis TaxID=1156355 RepID=UPI0011C02EC1|nr:S24 family peptidase [Paenibacillus taihuensis]